MNILKAVLTNTSSQVLSRVISSGAGFIITLLIARYVGIAGYSDLAKITALVGLFYLGIDLGANAIFLQFDKHEQRFSDLLSFRLLLSSLLFVSICLLTFILPFSQAATSGYSPVVKLGIILFSLSFFSRAVVYSCGAFFQQNLAYSNATKATLISSLVTLGIVIATVALQLPFLWIIVGYLVGGFLEGGVSWYFVKQNITITLPSFVFSKKLFFATLPLTLLLFLNLFYFRVDMILLSLFQKSHDVGVYDFAYKFFDFLIALPLFLSNSLYPILLGLEKNSRIQRKNISLYTAIFFFLGCILIPFVWYLSPFIALVKQDFLPSVLPLRILSLSLPIFFATNILQWIFITKKKQSFLAILYAASLILNILLNVLFIPHYSYVASALITGFSETLILAIMLISLLFIKL